MPPPSDPSQNRGFPATRWSIVLAARGLRTEASRAAFDRLVSTYWEPVYWLMRRGWKKGTEDAEDLTQEFFLRIMQRGGTEGYDPEKGRFRTFLYGAVKNHLLQERRDRTRFKRGAGKLPFSLDRIRERGFEPAGPEASPEETFHREWVAAVLREAVSKLKEECGRTGKQIYFEVFRRYDLVEGIRPTYRDIAQQVVLSADDVHTRLRWTRQRLRDIVRATVRETLTDPSELQDEMKLLFG